MPLIQANLPSSRTVRGSEGWRDTVDYLVRATSGVQAIQDCGIAHGAAHPSLGGIFAFDFAAQLAQGDEPHFWRVSVTWRAPEPNSTADEPPPPTSSGGIIQIGARVQPATFSRDVSGAQIKTQHTFSETGKAGTETQPAEVEGFLPQTVLTVTRTESQDPLALRQHVGKTNDSQFFGEAIDTWLCTAIEGISEDGGATYTVTYEFELRDQTWDVEVVFIDERTGRPIEGLTQGVELQSYRIYERSNFAGLNLE